jgi:hypothetical protein
MTDFNFEDFVDFDNVIQETVEVKKEKHILQYDTPFDDTTTSYYKAHRIAKTDPIDFIELNDKNAFKFKYMWNPYNGERLKEDIFGPLYMNPVNIVRSIYMNRLNNLWIKSSDTDEGYFQAYYGDNVGIGDDFHISGRGFYPERYLFRIPIVDLYLSPDHRMSIITMGPKLTDQEILEIDKLIVDNWSDHPYIKKIYPKIKSLTNLKKFYDIAICKKPTSLHKSLLTELKLICPKNVTNPDSYINRLAVDALKNM